MIPKSFDEIVNEIKTFTTFSLNEIKQRVWQESIDFGSNVALDVKEFGVTPHYYNENMEKMYKEGYGFIFETLVFWSKKFRQCWIRDSLKRIEIYCESKSIPKDNLNILVYGDGVGNDSLFLVNNGYKVDYFDFPGSRTYEFALNRFESNKLTGDFINIISDYEFCLEKEYDAIICFEVLEHLSDPISTIKDMSRILTTEGIALITESFRGVYDIFPTHINSNKRFSNGTPFIFLENSMKLTWYSKEDLFKPMEFKKVDKTSISDFILLLFDPRMLKEYFFYKSRKLKHLLLTFT